jgi:putative glycosyltransferase (TIGR04348 family)
MKVLLVTPAPGGSRKGNRITAVRWARLLRELGHRARIAERYQGERCDLLVALHAFRSAESVARFRAERPEAPLVVALTGTDVYGDIHATAEARRSMELADRLIVLQPLAIEQLPAELRGRARVIYQSVGPLPSRPAPRKVRFEVCVMGHLRPVKDPFRTAEAARLVPAESRLRVLHLGSALSEDMAEQARSMEASNPRYHWLGDVPRGRAMRHLARCRLLSLTSLSEGGANVIGEAVTVGTPVVSSRIDGSVGLLGDDYPGYFPVGDTAALAELLWRAESDAAFLIELRERCERVRGLFEPQAERGAWRALLAELGGLSRGRERH